MSYFAPTPISSLVCGMVFLRLQDVLGDICFIGLNLSSVTLPAVYHAVCDIWTPTHLLFFPVLPPPLAPPPSPLPLFLFLPRKRTCIFCILKWYAICRLQPLNLITLKNLFFPDWKRTKDPQLLLIEWEKSSYTVYHWKRILFLPQSARFWHHI